MQEHETAIPSHAVVGPDTAEDPRAEGGTSLDVGSKSGLESVPDRVRDALTNVFDPELGINIVDLGLVYDIQVDEQGGVDIEYTLTTMGCPIGPLIEDQMRALLANVEGVQEVRPEMVLRPAWSPEMMSDEAKAALGIF